MWQVVSSGVVAKIVFLVFFFSSSLVGSRENHGGGSYSYVRGREYTLRIPNNNLLCQPTTFSHDKQRELDKSKSEFVSTFGNRAFLKKVVVLKCAF